MKFHLRIVQAVLVFVLTSTMVWSDESQVARFALLIGVQEYPNLSDAEQLDGCENDVRILSDVLTARLNVPAENITRLVNDGATSTAIRAEMERMVQRVERRSDVDKPAQVVFYFSGHGSQIADSPEHPDELDGLDETLVTYDATKQGSEADIRDDEIHDFVERLTSENRACVFVVLDCCHSGTGARGGVAKYRQLKRDLVKPTAISPQFVQQRRLPVGAVFLSACRANEKEPEFVEANQAYGLLTHFLVNVLHDSKQQLSYKQLQESIVSRYYASRKVVQPPMPQIEGNAASLRQPLLGSGTTRTLDYFPVAKTKDGLVVQAGRLHSIGVGSQFELFRDVNDLVSDSADRKTSLGMLTVTESRELTALATFSNANGKSSRASQLPSDFRKGIASIRTVSNPPIKLTVRIKHVDASQADATRIDRLLGDANAHKAWLEIVSKDDNGSVDVELRVAETEATLHTVNGADRVWGPFDLLTSQALGRDDSRKTLIATLSQIVRSRNLLSIAGEALSRSSVSSRVGIELLSIDFDDQAEQVRSAKPVPPERQEFKTGDVYAYRLTNQTESPVYVTLINVRPDLAIEVVMPFEEPAIKLSSGQSRDSDPFRCREPLGKNQTVLVVTTEPFDFSFLAEPKFPRQRSAAVAESILPLFDSLGEVAYFQPPKSRGRRRKTTAQQPSWHMQIFNWDSVAP